jgi:hypothetical protein
VNECTSDVTAAAASPGLNRELLAAADPSRQRYMRHPEPGRSLVDVRRRPQRDEPQRRPLDGGERLRFVLKHPVPIGAGKALTGRVECVEGIERVLPRRFAPTRGLGQ